MVLTGRPRDPEMAFQMGASVFFFFPPAQSSLLTLFAYVGFRSGCRIAGQAVTRPDKGARKRQSCSSHDRTRLLSGTNTLLFGTATFFRHGRLSSLFLDTTRFGRVDIGLLSPMHGKAPSFLTASRLRPFFRPASSTLLQENDSPVLPDLKPAREAMRTNIAQRLRAD